MLAANHQLACCTCRDLCMCLIIVCSLQVLMIIFNGRTCCIIMGLRCDAANDGMQIPKISATRVLILSAAQWLSAAHCGLIGVDVCSFRSAAHCQHSVPLCESDVVFCLLSALCCLLPTAHTEQNLLVSLIFALSAAIACLVHLLSSSLHVALPRSADGDASLELDRN